MRRGNAISKVLKSLSSFVIAMKCFPDNARTHTTFDSLLFTYNNIPGINLSHHITHVGSDQSTWSVTGAIPSFV